MFGFGDTDTTIWICQCCGFRAWIESKATDDNEYRCPLCDHAAQAASIRYPTEEELREQEEKLRKWRKS
jgi:DNA-directed RNA polymerase subunit RPC12/RpoP